MKGYTRSLDYGSYWGYMGIMEKKVETTGIIWGLYRDYRVHIRVYIRVLLGLYRDNGKENGNYYLGS